MAKLHSDSASLRWPGGLLGENDPDPVQIEGRNSGPYVIICDHAGNRIPESLGDLGVSKRDRERHIGWDIGALEVARVLAVKLGAILIYQTYSRLVIDCNRPPHSPQAIPEYSDGTIISGNTALPQTDAAARVAEIFQPYHCAISKLLDDRASGKTLLLSIHSYTPEHGEDMNPRPWPISFLFNRERALSDRMAEHFRKQGMQVGMNEPYSVDALSDYAIPVHAERRNLECTLIEIRQDLIADAQGQQHWANLLAEAAMAELEIDQEQ